MVKTVEPHQPMADSSRRTYWITTFGCQMNKADSERIAGVTPESMGYSAGDGEDQADLVLYNTCTIRDNAEQKVYSYLGRQARRKRDNPALTLVVAGCGSTRGGVLLRRVPELDLVMGPQHANRLDTLLSQVEAGQQVVATDDHHILEDITTARRDAPCCAWVNVIYGCNERCTYCVVPSVRGQEHHACQRPSAGDGGAGSPRLQRDHPAGPKH